MLMALMYRRRTGLGVYIDYAQLEATTTLVGEIVADCSVNGRVATRRGNSHPVAAPHGIYPCRDEDTWVAIAVFGDDQFARLCGLMERPGLALDPRFADPLARHRNREQLDVIVAEWTGRHERYGLVRLLQRDGLAAGVVHSSASLWGDPHLKERGATEEIERAVIGKKPYPRPGLRLSRPDSGPTRPAPTLGQHNDRVLGQVLGISDEELVILERDRVIGVEPLTTAV